MSRLCFSVTVILVLLLFGPGHSNASASANEESKMNPGLTIVMILLVSIFFALGCIFVYMRSCLERALGINNNNPPLGETVTETTSGLAASVIETFPTFRYSTVKTLRIGKEALECPVCLGEFEDDETLRLIPQCCHVFHPACIDPWLRTNTTCPLCRSNLVPVPGESVSFQIPGETGQNSPGKRVWGSPDDDRLFDAVAWTGNQSMPRKSMSTGWKLAGLFNQSSSNDAPGENLDRYTLRLPQELHEQLVNQGSKDNMVLPQVRSPLRGYKTESLGTERNYFYFERFDKDGRLDRRPFSITPPYRTDSIRSPDGVIEEDSNYQEGSGPPKGLLLAIRSPLNRLINGKTNVGGERSYLRSGDASPV